jgi:hypothetical protein
MSPRSGRQRCRPFHGLTRFLLIGPGACAPGFILPPASQVQHIRFADFQRKINMAKNPGEIPLKPPPGDFEKPVA